MAPERHGRNGVPRLTEETLRTGRVRHLSAAESKAIYCIEPLTAAYRTVGLAEGISTAELRAFLDCVCKACLLTMLRRPMAGRAGPD